MLNIIIPMAGRALRFARAGYSLPKPLIPIFDKPMIQWVIENIRPACNHRFIFICLKEHLESFPELERQLRSLCPSCEIIRIPHVTEGAACTVLLARDLIDDSNPLMIANGDQYVTLDINEYLREGGRTNPDGFIMTFWADHPKWSYCHLDGNSKVTEVVEKQVISNEATVGIYNFRRGRDFVQAADQMIAKNLRVNREFYVAPVYNQIIERGGVITVVRIREKSGGMYGLGTPEDLDLFIRTFASNYRASLRRV